MKYDFDKVIDRTGTNALKYERRGVVFGRQDVIPLWVADMDFPTAQPVIDAVTKRAQDGIWGYSERPDSYFQAVCDWQERRKGWKVDPACCSFALGVMQGIAAIIQYSTQPGDKILIFTPSYDCFYGVIRDNNRTVVESFLVEQSDGSWKIDFEDFEKKLDEVKMFLLCSPHNPLGIVWKREELEKMVSLCRKKGVMLISDEIHSDLVIRGPHIPTASLSPEAAEYVIACVSGTKTFNMAGMQAATIVFPNVEQKETFDKFWGRLEISFNNALSIPAMEAAFREGDEWLDQLKEYIDGNFHYIHKFFAENIPEIKVRIPDATYLMWVDFRGLNMPHDELVQFLVHDAGVGLGNGHNYCPALDGFMRLNVACSRKLLEKAMEQLLAAWKKRQQI